MVFRVTWTFFYAVPYVKFCFGNQINNKRKMEWIQEFLFIYACSNGEYCANEDNSGVIFMLPPDEVKVTFMIIAKAGIVGKKGKA